MIGKNFEFKIWMALFVSLASVLEAASKPIELTCDHRTNPVGVEKPAPNLSWKLSENASQKAFRVQVASTAALLETGTPDLWDSEWVNSEISQNIPYAGAALASRQQCFWRVTVRCAGSDKPEWSDVARWEMALLHPDDWSAQWVRSVENPPVEESDALKAWMFAAANIRKLKTQRRPSDWQPGTVLPKEVQRLRALEPATWLRKDFVIRKKVTKARLYSTAAGYGDFFLDGRKLGKRVFNPAQTDFDKRILYDVDVLDDVLKPGQHTIAARLGQGFYGQNAGFSDTKFYYGRPAVLAQLEVTYEDGSTETIVSDASWKTRSSAIVKNNVYAGEVFDGRLFSSTWNLPGADLSAWADAESLETSPTRRLEVGALPPIEVVRRVQPVEVLNPAPGVWVFDFGQNFTGFVEMETQRLGLPSGEAVWLRYAEWADAEGNIGMNSGGGFATKVNQVDAYIAGEGAPLVWRPAFSWHGFRYVEIAGLSKQPDPSLLSGCLVRSSVKPVGRFRCSDAHVNRIHETALWTYESNLIGLPSDCPIRERCGWTGDAHAALTLSNYNFDMALFWEKYLADFGTSRNISPAIVPGKRSNNGKPDWPVAQVFIAAEHYLFHHDLSLVRREYPRMQQFMEYYHRTQKEWLFTIGFGDWCDPVKKPGAKRVGGRGKPQQTSVAATTTALFVKGCRDMKLLAAALGKKADAERYADWARQASMAFHKAFFKQDAGSYGSQTANAMALEFDIVPEAERTRVAKALNRDVLDVWGGHFSVGALGQRWLYPALADNGYADTAFNIFHAKGHPGFHYLFDELNGTSLWERKGAFNPKTMKQPERSLSHPFQGGYDAWFFLGLGGIRPEPEKPGFKRVILRPCFPRALEWTDVEYDSPYGLIQSRWERKGDTLTWEITLPPNTTGILKPLGKEIMEDGKRIDPSVPHTLINGTHRLIVSP